MRLYVLQPPFVRKSIWLRTGATQRSCERTVDQNGEPSAQRSAWKAWGWKSKDAKGSDLGMLAKLSVQPRTGISEQLWVRIEVNSEEREETEGENTSLIKNKINTETIGFPSIHREKEMG